MWPAAPNEFHTFGLEQKKPTNLEEVKSHFSRGEQKLIEEVEFMRRGVFTMVIINKETNCSLL